MLELQIDKPVCKSTVLRKKLVSNRVEGMSEVNNVLLYKYFVQPLGLKNIYLNGESKN